MLMQQKKLFRYFGAKTYLEEDIVNLVSPLYTTHKITCFVDVFGGAGNVLLNLPVEWRINRVYNDIDSRLYNLMMDLLDEDKRNKLFEKLYWSLSSRKYFNELKEKENNDSFEFLYRYFNAFNSDINNYGMRINVVRNSYDRQLNNLKNNWKYIKGWAIECLDFETLIKKYDSKTTFFYLDPPYLTGGKKYKHSFDMEDFKRLKSVLDNMQGYYLMNESDADFKEIKELFGEPKFVKKYVNTLNHNRAQSKSENRNLYRLEGFWHNF